MPKLWDSRFLIKESTDMGKVMKQFGKKASAYSLLNKYLLQILLIKINFLFLTIVAQMNAPNRKTQVPNRPNKNIPHRSNSHNPLQKQPPSNTRKISENISNNKMEVAVKKVSVVSPLLTAQQLILKVQDLSLEALQFDQLWIQFLEVINSYFKLKVIFLSPLVQPGYQVLKDGRFLVAWLKIITKVVYKTVEQRQAKNVVANKQVLEQYLKMNIKDGNQTPSKNGKGGQSLKRSILKNSEKKVQFGRDEILYPKLEVTENRETDQRERREKDVDILRQMKNKNQKVWRLQCDNNFLLHYLNIVEIYLLDEVEVVGVLKEVGQMFVILIAKDKVNKKQRICFGVRGNNKDKEPSLHLLDQIKSSYPNLCFLDIQGRDPNEIWVDSIPDQKRV